MSASAIAGLLALNALYLGVGLAVLWLLRGFDTWSDVARLAGLALLVGVAVTGVLWSLLLIAGLPFGLWAVLSIPVLLTAGLAIGAGRRGRLLPISSRVCVRSAHFVAAAGIAAAGLVLELLFRVSRLSGLYWWDAWSFWIPKAKAVYHLGRIDVEFFTTLPGPSYPPLVPVLDAAAFHVMGGTDVVTLHVQYWLFAVGFVWAFAGLLAERVPAWVLWPFVLLVLVAPRIGPRVFVAEADLFLNFLFVLAAILLVSWVFEREPWRLVVAFLLMGGMVMTKREGFVLVGAVLLAALLASIRDWRFTAPRIGAVALGVLVVAVPWRIWYVAHGAEGEGAGSQLNPTENTERLWPSVRLALDVLFSSDYWSVAVPVAVCALVLALVTGSTGLVVFFGSLIGLVTLGGALFTWAIRELPITQDLGGNPIVRYMGAAALACIAASPLLLAATWRRVTDEPGVATR